MATKYQLAFASFRLDPANATLSREGEPIELRPKTFDVLRYLVEHAGRLVTQAELLDAIWKGAVVSVTMPAICIGELRKALRDEVKKPGFIETVHRRGYRFIAPVARVLPEPKAGSPRSRVSSLTPLVGRESEFKALRDHLDHLSDGAGGVVLIGGAAGIGKTRLLEEVEAAANQSGMTALSGNCYDRQDPLPFGPFVEILETVLEQAPRPTRLRELLGPGAAEISRLAPQLHRLLPEVPEPMKLPPLQSQRMLFNALGKLFERLAAEAPLVLLIEDLHWADQGTLALVSHMVRRAEKLGLMMLMTYRSDEVETHPPFARALEELLRGRAIGQFTLRGLDSKAAASMARTLAGRDLPMSLVRLVEKTTDRNPFFITELFRHFGERGLTLSDEQMRAELTTEPLKLPQSLRVVLERRLHRVGEETRSMLGVAGIIGRSFPLALLAAAAGKGSRALAASVDEAEKAGLLTSTLHHPEARFHFAHELIRQAVVSAMPGLQRQQLHVKVAGAIRRLYPNTVEEWTGELAHHLWNAGTAADVEKTIHHLQLAGQRAVRSSANIEAISYFRRALQLIPSMPESARRDKWELDLLIELGAPLTANAGFASIEVEAVFSRAYRLCDQTGDTRELFRTLMALYHFRLVRGELATALTVANRCLHLAESTQDDTFLMEAHRAIGTTVANMGNFSTALQHFERALALHDSTQHDSLALAYGFDPKALNYSVTAVALWFLGFPEQAARRRDEALDRARELSHPHTTTSNLGLAAWLTQMGGDPTETFARAGRAVEYASEQDFPQWVAYSLILRGWARGKQGDFTQGIKEITEGLATFSALGEQHLKPFSLVLLAEIKADAGDPALGLGTLNEALENIDRTGEVFWVPEAYRLRGELLLQAARHHGNGNDPRDEAKKCFRRAIAIAREQESRMLELRATVSLSRLLREEGSGIEAREMLADIYGWFTEGFDTMDLKAAKSLLDKLDESAEPAAKC